MASTSTHAEDLFFKKKGQQQVVFFSHYDLLRQVRPFLPASISLEADLLLVDKKGK
jgi:hypothetical protein